MDYLSAQESEKSVVALSSVTAAFVVTGLKVGVGLWTGSLGILSEAAHSGLDLIAAIITLLAVKFSARPPDKTHLYGHGKIENFSALAETVLLLVTCFWIINEAVKRLLFHSVQIEVNVWSFFVMFVSIAVDLSRSRALYRVARKHRSQALEADALHFSTDVWSSSVVVLGLVLTLLKIPVADSVAALIVAFFVIYVTLSLGKRTINELLDRAPAGLEEEVQRTALGMPGVQRVDNVRVRTSGPKTFVDLTLHLRRTTPFEVANTQVHEVETAIHRVIPDADIIIHPEPMETDDETVVDKVKLLLSREGWSAHDVQAFLVNGSYQVEFQIEFPDGDFVRAHNIVDELEERVKKELPRVASVVVHIEDARENVIASVDVTPSSQELIHDILEIAAAMQEIHECTVLSVLEVKGKYRVSMKCAVGKDLSLENAHEICTALKNKIMVALPDIKEVHIHAEPTR
ncbi:MAG: cation diffusion facilitator family transporter [Bacteroidota bacterium]|nr:cation diffusion facilitator family transporter [Bacteroidota bacterium]